MAVLYSNLFSFSMAMWAVFWKCSWVLWCFDVWWSWWRKLCLVCRKKAILFLATSGFYATSDKSDIAWKCTIAYMHIRCMNMRENAWNDDRHFLRTPLESAFAFQWEDAKWPPQSDESYILFVHMCCVIPFLAHSFLEMACVLPVWCWALEVSSWGTRGTLFANKNQGILRGLQYSVGHQISSLVFH